MFLSKSTRLTRVAGAFQRIPATTALPAVQHRDYFSLWEKMRDRIQQPLRHIESFVEPDGYGKNSQMPEGYRMYGNTANSFSASLTQNSIELFEWHEMESTVHSQFGTVDNPVLVFTSDNSWRIVICMGPGIEDDSHSHEKIYYMVREGPINRCHICGQCFKLVRLKDEFSQEGDYYSLMFSTLSHFDVSEEDLAINLTSFFGDRPQATMQTVPATTVYIHVNPDEASRILVDPAYKLERTKEAHEKLYAMHESYRAIDKQMASQRQMRPLPYGRDNYETWVAIEKSIRKFDRIFNKVEKFEARKFSDPDNFERREKRMQERRNKRLVENYTYYFGGLTEEELQYQDYFETDIDEDPEDEAIEEFEDKHQMALAGDFDPKLYDFVETSLRTEVIENFEDLVADKIFKYKYRQFSDPTEVYIARQNRVRERFFDRAITRDPQVEADLVGVYQQDQKDNSVAQLMLDQSKFDMYAEKATSAKREYMVREGLQQYRDYFEDDAEEQKAFEYLDNLSNRDRIRFMEVFEDFTQDPFKGKVHASIQKREYNPELSGLNNLLLDLVDFKDRVRPLANDLSLLDTSRAYQSRPMTQAFGSHNEAAHGITKEQLDAMSPEDRAAYDESIACFYDEDNADVIERAEQDHHAKAEFVGGNDSEEIFLDQASGLESNEEFKSAIRKSELQDNEDIEVVFTDDENAEKLSDLEELMKEVGLTMKDNVQKLEATSTEELTELTDHASQQEDAAEKSSTSSSSSDDESKPKKEE